MKGALSSSSSPTWIRKGFSWNAGSALGLQDPGRRAPGRAEKCRANSQALGFAQTLRPRARNWQGDKDTHVCWAHSDSCYFRNVSTLRQVRCQANAVLGFCPAVPSPPLLTRMTCSWTGESISVHSPALQSHKKPQTNRSLRSLPLPGGLWYYHERFIRDCPFAKGALKAAV